MNPKRVGALIFWSRQSEIILQHLGLTRTVAYFTQGFYSGTFLKFPCQMKLETSWNLSRIPMNSKEFLGINV